MSWEHFIQLMMVIPWTVFWVAVGFKVSKNDERR